MKLSSVLITLAIALLLSACAGRHRQGGDIIIETKNVDMEMYYQDLHECRNYAAQVKSGEKTLGRAIGGAIVGGAVGAIVGDSGTAKRAAGAGGVLGGAEGVGAAHREKRQVVRNCLRGRGYRVLN